MVIDIFTTTLLHADHSRVLIPNRKIVGEILHNFGVIRQLHLTVPLSHRVKIDDALAHVKDILQQHPLVLKYPAPSVGVSSLGESSIALAVEPWAAVTNYNVVQGELNKLILERFRTHGIELPSSRHDVHVLNG